MKYRGLICIVVVVVVFSACSRSATRFAEIQNIENVPAKARFDHAKVEMNKSGFVMNPQQCSDATFEIEWYDTRIPGFKLSLIYNKKANLVGMHSLEFGKSEFSAQAEEIHAAVIASLRSTFGNVIERSRTKDDSRFVEKLMSDFPQSKCFHVE